MPTQRNLVTLTGEVSLKADKALDQLKKIEGSLDRIQAKAKSLKLDASGLKAPASGKGGATTQVAKNNGYTISKAIKADLSSSIIKNAVTGFQKLLTKSLTVPVKLFTKMITGAIRTARTGLSLLGGYVGGAVGNILSTSSAATDAFNSEFSTVRALAVEAGSAQEQIAELKATTLGLAASLPVTTREIAGAAKSLLKANKGITQINDSMLESAAKLSVALDVPTDKTAAIAAAADNVLTGGDIAKKMDILATATNSANQDIYNLAGALASLKGTQLPTEEFGLFTSILADAQIKGEIAGTTIRNFDVFAKKRAEDLKAYGIEVFDAQGNFRGLEQVLIDTTQAARGLNDAQQAQLQQLFGERGGGLLKAALLKSPEEFQELQTRMASQAEGTVNRLVDVMMKGLSGSLKQMEAASEAMEVAIGEGLQGFRIAWAQTMTELFTSITGGTDLEDSLKRMTQTLLEPFATIETDALSGQMMVTLNDNIKRFLQDAGQKFREWIRSIPELVQKGKVAYGQFIGVVERTRTVLNQLRGSGEFKSIVNSAVQMREQFGQVLRTVVELGKRVISFVRPAITPLAKALDSVRKIAVDLVKYVGDKLGKVLRNLTPLVRPFAKAFGEIGKLVANVFSLLVKIIAKTVELISRNKLLIGILRGAAKLVATVVGWVNQWFENQERVNKVVAVVAHTLNIIFKVLLAAVALIKGPLIAGWVVLAAKVTAVVALIKLIVKLVTGVYNLIKKIVGATVDWASQFGVVKGLANGIKGIFGGIFEWSVNIGKSIGGWIKNIRIFNRESDKNRGNVAGALGDAASGRGAQVQGSGLITGPSLNIGGAHMGAYHIDHKIPKAVGEEMAVAMMDQLAEGYAAQGKEMEFSNTGVAGRIWDVSASLDEKIAFLREIDKAHSHSPRPAYWDADYYIPDIGKGRRDRSAEGAEMLIPNIAGARAEYGTASGYGNFVNVYDENGKLLFKMGHGDNREDLPSNFTMQAKPTVVGATMSAAQRVTGQNGPGGYIPKGGTLKTAERVHSDPEGAAAILATAQRLGLDPYELAALMSWESGGSFNPNVRGGDGNLYKGMIQFSPDNQRTYGTGDEQSIADQMVAVEQYLKDRGFQPGDHDIRHAYSAVLAGQADESYWNRKDSNGTSVRNAAPKFREGEHAERARQFMEDSLGGVVQSYSNAAEQAVSSGEELFNFDALNARDGSSFPDADILLPESTGIDFGEIDALDDAGQKEYDKWLQEFQQRKAQNARNLENERSSRDMALQQRIDEAELQQDETNSRLLQIQQQRNSITDAYASKLEEAQTQLSMLQKQQEIGVNTDPGFDVSSEIEHLQSHIIRLQELEQQALQGLNTAVGQLNLQIMENTESLLREGEGLVAEYMGRVSPEDVYAQKVQEINRTFADAREELTLQTQGLLDLVNSGQLEGPDLDLAQARLEELTKLYDDYYNAEQLGLARAEIEAQNAEQERQLGIMQQQVAIQVQKNEAAAIAAELRGNTSLAESLRAQNAELEQQVSHEQTLLDIENQRMENIANGMSPEDAAQMAQDATTAAEQLNSANMDKINADAQTLANTLKNQIKDGVSDMIMGFIDGSKSIGDSFKDMLKTLANTVIKAGINKMLGGLLGGAGGGGGGGLGGLLGGLFNDGGRIPGGGPDKDTKIIGATPGEYVINRKAARNIGYDVLDRMNRTASDGTMQFLNSGGTVRGVESTSGRSALYDSLDKRREATRYTFETTRVGEIDVVDTQQLHDLENRMNGRLENSHKLSRRELDSELLRSPKYRATRR